MVEFRHLEDPQKLAALAHDRNYAVTAGAGSGKTTTFAMRYLKLLETTDADPHSTAAITFTESGAAELKERVRESVSDRLDETDGDGYERWREYHDALPEAYIHTIHGFCSRLLHEHALEADVPVGFDVIEETAARGHQLETVESFVEDHLDDERIEELTHIYYRDRLEDLLGDLLEEHQHAREWADEWADQEPSDYVEFVRERYSPIDVGEARTLLDRPDVEEALRDIRQVADEESAGGNRISIAQNVATAVETHDIIGAALNDVATHDAAAALCEALTSDRTPYYGSWDSWCYGGHDDWDDENAERYDEATSALVEALPVERWAIPGRLAVERNAAPYYISLASLFRDLHDEYEDRKRRERVLDFADLIDGCIDLLRSSPTVRADVRESFDHVMLDEVQDTDPRQWELVELLTSLDAEYDGLNVFVVGDEKQSIFRFRGADVTQYAVERERLAQANQQASVPPLEETYEVGEGRDLSRNFRSLPGVLEPINELFDDLFGQVPQTHQDAPPGIRGDDTSFEPDPQRLAPDRTDEAEIGLGATFVLVPEERPVREEALTEDHQLRALPEDGATLDARALAAEVAAFLDDAPERYEVTGYEDGDPVEEPVELEPKDVAILLRKRTHLESYERALASLNVPYTVASGIGFYESTEITAIRNLLAVLQDPIDDLALFGVLRSPLFGFEDTDVVGLWDSIERDDIGDGELWRALQRTDHDRLTTARERIETWRRLAGCSGPTPLVETWDALLGRIIEDTGYLASLALDERGQQAIANVEKFRDRLREWGEDGLQTLPEVVDRIDREVELSSREGEAAVPEDADGVRIMTVHDAKGQEFPAVFVPGLSTDFNLRPGYGENIAEFEIIEDPLTDDRQPLLGIRAPGTVDVFEQQDTILKRRLNFSRKREAVAEEKRILYVAATRARDHLFLIGTAGSDDESVESLDTGDRGEPSNWYDIVAPEILSNDVLEELAVAGSTAVPEERETPVTVRFPRMSAESASTDAAEPISLEPDVDAYEVEPEYDIAASYLGSLIEDGAPGDIVVDHTGRYVSYEPPENDSGSDTSSSGSESTGLPRNVFGDVVHKAVELRVNPDDESTLLRLTEQVATQHEVSSDNVTQTDLSDISRHVATASEYLNSLDEGGTVDEKMVRAMLDSGQLYGYVDHISKTDGGYHVVDYKTNDISRPHQIEAKSDYYEWQMKAYAVALHQSNPQMDVEATLLFTEAGAQRSFLWSPEELEDLETELDATVCSRLSTHL
ncbi:UvrD-helicase domain-containing protein [Haloplanus halobius]|uniref:UvrD-helicase domain-containing protein n=1 Tax=Haloplanus halobius TaxID=2934938 RepID=UPI00200CB86A|nr:UvrD-helicase domain-containing protein [Haloplanus sp. XH21]